MVAYFDRPKCDRVPVFDEASRNYGMAPLLAGTAPDKKVLWEIPSSLPLNQGREGACVGFGWCGELAVGPVEIAVTNGKARSLYQAARAEDERMGNQFADGASVLAGARVVKRAGEVSAYRWSFGIEQVCATLKEHGPVVLGIPWYDSMYETDPQARVVVNGQVVGGHCIIAAGYIPASDPFAQKLAAGTALIELVNSWGLSWGLRGVGYMRVPDLNMLLKQDGESCVATDRKPRKRNMTLVERIGQTRLGARVRREFSAG